jgi:tetratricopeptide (TPR) repeat protein
VSWLAAIVDPSSLIRRAQREESPPPEVGLALLLDGEAQLYQMIAPRQGWPVAGESVSSRADARKRLLAAVVAHLWASGDAEEMYRRLVRVKQTEISATSALLLAYLYADSGRLPRAVELLTKQAALPRDAEQESLLRLQLSVRLAEMADYGRAVAECDRVVQLSKRAKPRAWSDAFRLVAVWNRHGYLWEGGTYTNPLELPVKGESQLLLRPAISYSGALSNYLDTTFESSLSDPSARTVRFQPRDPVEGNLEAAVIHCELIGDWSELRRARKQLGRYLVLTRLGTPQGVPPAALELLRRAGDDKGIQLAARTIHRLGPLGPLQLATQAVIERRELGGANSPASLRLLAVGADVLGEDGAAAGIGQLLGTRNLVSEFWADAPAALSGLVRAAPSGVQTEVALFLRAQAADPVNDVLAQDLAGVVGAIRWDAVDASERKLWLSFLEEALEPSAPSHLVGVYATLALANVEPVAIEQLLTARLSQRPDLGTLALAYQSLDPPPLRIRSIAWEIVGPALREARAQAQRGTYEFPTIDIAALATAVLREEPRNATGWDELVSFLLDKSVAMSAKVRAMEALADMATSIPASARRLLKTSLWETTGFEDPIFSRSDEFSAALLRLAGRLGATSRDQLLAALLELSGSPSLASRIAAAGAIPPLQKRIGSAVAATLALAMTRDANQDVRAAAGNAIAQLDVSDDRLLQRSLEIRTIELLGEPGLVVPHGVLRGLHAELLRNRALPSGVAREVEQLTKRHLSRAVRNWADEVTRLGADTKSNPLAKRP